MKKEISNRDIFESALSPTSNRKFRDSSELSEANLQHEIRKSSKKNQNNFGIIEEEFGGPKGPEPTRYGDWEKNGRVSDF